MRAPRVKRRNEHGYSHFESANHLIVETGEQSVGVRIEQLPDRSPHVPTEEELRRQKAASLTADDERAAAFEWVEWASGFTEYMELNRDMAIPVEVEPKPKALQPFMRGWSPYGPWADDLATQRRLGAVPWAVCRGHE